MRLDRGHGDSQQRRDLAVGAPFRQGGEHLALARRERVEGSDSGGRAALAVAAASTMPASAVALDAGLSRESLYRALSADGNPSFATVLKVARALGVKFHAEPA